MGAEWRRGRRLRRGFPFHRSYGGRDGGQGSEDRGWGAAEYRLMGNHFHLVVETPQPNLSDGMKWVLQTYTGRFNRRHGFSGHVFSGRFKAPLVDGSGSG